MPDLLEITRDYHKIVSKRLEASGLSPEQLAVHKRTLELAASVKDVGDLEAKKEAEDLTFKLAQSISIDNWNAKAKAALESGEWLARDVFDETCKEAKASSNHASLAKSVDEASAKGAEKLAIQEYVKSSFLSALYAIFAYRITHPANAEERKRQKANLDIYSSEIKKKGANFEQLLKDTYFKSFAPLSGEQWQEVEKVCKSMQSAETDKQAQTSLAEDVKKATEALKGKSKELKELQVYIESTGTREAYLGISPKVEPGPYTFEKIWEGSRDE
ncbi:hypothetical protein GX441_02605 [bacterium]|nr:hypothetical protein [bacterium]